MNESATKKQSKEDKVESVPDGNKDAFDALLKAMPRKTITFEKLTS